MERVFDIFNDSPKCSCRIEFLQPPAPSSLAASKAFFMSFLGSGRASTRLWSGKRQRLFTIRISRCFPNGSLIET